MEHGTWVCVHRSCSVHTNCSERKRLKSSARLDTPLEKSEGTEDRGQEGAVGRHFSRIDLPQNDTLIL